MNNHEAKQILMLFRPGTADEKDPFFDEARRLATTDPELARWLDAHCESYRILREKFRSIQPPAGLKEQILSERKIHRLSFPSYRRPALALAASMVLLLGIGFGIWHTHPANRYSAYRKRMTETALRSYYMEFPSTNQTEIRNFLKSKEAPADYSLPSGLKTVTAVGCVVSQWQGKPVSMICFKSGRPLNPGDISDVWFFVIDNKFVANAPAQEKNAPLFARVNKATTATWSSGGKVYLLAAVGDEEFLRKYLE
ncbi:MAG TPA: hypothetical protein VGN61_02005 [Verrucomicrobiae bacterium]